MFTGSKIKISTMEIILKFVPRVLTELKFIENVHQTLLHSGHTAKPNTDMKIEPKCSACTEF